MQDPKNVKSPAKRDIEPGHPDYKPGNTATPKQKVDEDAKAEQDHESNKIVNEQDENQVVNDNEESTETSSQPVKMSDKPQPVNEEERN